MGILGEDAMTVRPSRSLPDYVELRCVTNFTFLRGASHAEELVVRAKALGYLALAITDECSMAGVVRAHVAAKAAQLPLLLGSQFCIQPRNETEAPFTLVVLAQNLNGYPMIGKWVIRSHYAKLGWTEVVEGMAGTTVREAVVSAPSGMHSTHVRILSTPPEGNYRALSEVVVKLTRWTPVERKYTREDVDQRLREKTMALGGNAIIHVRYDQKDHTLATAGYIEGRGLAIIDTSDIATCPFCAETIKREATRCKHCGSDIPKVAA